MILCIESATPVCSVALADHGKVISFREVNEGFSHAEKLTIFISEVLEEAKKNLKDLDAVAVSYGPGSYTGLRIGVSVAKGLCFALDKPLIGISTLEAMAAGTIGIVNSDDSNILFCPMIDARRMEVYCALYDTQLNCIHPPSAIVVDENYFTNYKSNRKIFYFGDGAEKCLSVLDNNFIYSPGIFPSAKYMSGIVLKKFNEKQFENLALFEPFYLKEYQPGRK